MSGLVVVGGGEEGAEDKLNIRVLSVAQGAVLIFSYQVRGCIFRWLPDWGQG